MDHQLGPSIAQVTVTIQDVNDEAPEFNQTTYEFPVRENDLPQTYLGTVQAHDPDSYPHNVFEYSMLSSGAIYETFLLNKDTGEIHTLQSLDRDTQPSFEIVVIARDRGSPPLVGTATVMVKIGDENDNAPMMDFPTPENNTVHISSQAATGKVVNKITQP